MLSVEIIFMFIGLEKAGSKEKHSKKSGRKARHFTKGGNETQEFRFVFLYLINSNESC